MTNVLPPLRFERHLLEKVWGGRALADDPGIELPPDVPIGETWEVVDRVKENSVVAEGPLAGRSLHDLVREHPRELLGSVPTTPKGRFPLLVKYIDASDDLSVQVHPDDATARRLGGGAEGKTEAWYVVGRREGGCVYAGLKPGVDAARFERVAQTPEVVDCMYCWDVEPGQCVLVPGGTVHAIGKGVTILEVQQNSDTTYRIWDWGRVGLDGKPRETHLSQALACTLYGAPAPAPVSPSWNAAAPGLRVAPLAHSDYFDMTALAVTGTAELETEGRFRIYAVTEGRGMLRVRGEADSWRLSRGDCWLVPACSGAHTIEAQDGELRLVRLS